MRRGTPGNTLLHGLALILASSVFLLAGAGCHWGKPEKPGIPPPGDKGGMRQPAWETAMPGKGTPTEDMPAAETAPAPSAPGPIPGAEPTVSIPPQGAPVASPAETAPPPSVTAGTREPAAVVPSGPQAVVPPPVPPLAPEVLGEPAKAGAPHSHEGIRNGKIPSNGARAHTSLPAEQNEPAWAAGKEELVYRVEFLGMTMGYARFTFRGKVAYNGKEVYHLSVRAWTSDFLSVIYPINETIDYYLDLKTLAPLRQEYTHAGKGKDDIAFYDQEKGKIVYRYKHNGEIRKQVDVPPDVHDPVSAAYYFRTRDLGASERPRNMYAGRKLWQISTRTLGVERIDTPRGPVDTVVIQPVIKRDGQPDNKGDMKMWMTNDARHVPVKIYAKFRKIRMWTLTAELVPAREGG